QFVSHRPVGAPAPVSDGTVAPVLEEGGGDEDDEDDEGAVADPTSVGVNVAGAADSRSCTGPLSAANVACGPSCAVIGASTRLPASAAHGTGSQKSFSGAEGRAQGTDVS